MASYLAPVERPKGLFIKLAYYFTRRQFGKVFGPLSVFSARMPYIGSDGMCEIDAQLKG